MAEMSLNESDVQYISNLINQTVMPMVARHIKKAVTGVIAKHGLAQGAQWIPAHGTTTAMFGQTLAFQDSTDGQVITYPEIPLLTAHPGDQYGPTGAERMVLIRDGSGYCAMFIHGPDDSPAVPAGERHIYHKTVATQALTTGAEWDGALKLTNDGPQSGDGLGGSHLGHQGALTTLNTGSGHEVALNDTSQTVATKTAGGHSQVFDDANSSVTLTTISGMTDIFNDNQQTITRSPALNDMFFLMDAGNFLITHQASREVFTEINAATQVITHQAGTGTLLSINNSSKYISAIAPIVSLGARPTSGNMYPSMTFHDIDTMLQNPNTGLNIQNLQMIRDVVAAIVTTFSGAPALGVVLTELWSILGISPPSLPGSFNSIATPTGSSVVQILQHT